MRELECLYVCSSCDTVAGRANTRESRRAGTREPESQTRTAKSGDHIYLYTSEREREKDI